MEESTKMNRLTLNDTVDIIDTVIQEEFKRHFGHDNPTGKTAPPFSPSEKKLKKPKRDVIYYINGPNLVFKTNMTQFAIEGMKFKPDSDHNKYENYLGMTKILIQIGLPNPFITKEDLEEESKRKFASAVKVIRALMDANVFLGEEGSSVGYLQMI